MSEAVRCPCLARLRRHAVLGNLFSFAHVCENDDKGVTASRTRQGHIQMWGRGDEGQWNPALSTKRFSDGSVNRSVNRRMEILS